MLVTHMIVFRGSGDLPRSCVVGTFGSMHWKIYFIFHFPFWKFGRISSMWLVCGNTMTTSGFEKKLMLNLPDLVPHTFALGCGTVV